MILDTQNYFAGGPLGTAGGQVLSATGASEHTINMTNVNVGNGEPIHICFIIHSYTGTATTFTVALQSHDDASFGAATTYATWSMPLNTTGIYCLGVLPSWMTAGEKYLRLNIVLAGTTSKTFSAALANDVPSA
jgi:hypothetical protein